MGLDMFLDGVNYISAYRKREDGSFEKVGKRKIIRTLELEWRKANQIHKYFVDTIQNGEDDCRTYEVDKEILIDLKNKCERILNANNRIKVAKKTLPTQGGMFFGNTDYDNFYFEDIKYTKENIERILQENKYDWFVYSSSW